MNPFEADPAPVKRASHGIGPSAEELNVKTPTLRNYREWFNPYLKQENSNRRGWHRIKLSCEYQTIKDDYDGMDYASVKNEIEAIRSVLPYMCSFAQNGRR